MSAKCIRVAIIDSQSLVRSGFRALLEQSPDIQLVAEGSELMQVQRLLDEGKIDVLVIEPLDSQGGWTSTLRDLGSLVKRLQDFHCLILTSSDDEMLFNTGLQSGVHGYLRKVVEGSELLLAIRLVFEGHRFVHRSASHYRSPSPLTSGLVPSVFEKLTPREREVLALTVEGFSGPQIAAELHISVRTAESHRANIMRKLKVRNLAELLRAALPAGARSLP